MDDTERETFRRQLSELTFEELIKLKHEVGAKIYNEEVNGKVSRKPIPFHRENKNRPREMSSKIPFYIEQPKEQSKSNSGPRDPRFDSKCGEFNEEVFNKQYGFLKDIRQKEKNKLIRQLNDTKKPEKRENIKFLIQRIENKESNELRKQHKADFEKAEKEARKNARKEGKKTFYYKKSEIKLMELFSNYENLKKSGKLVKHIERKAKNKKAKDNKKLSSIKRKIKQTAVSSRSTFHPEHVFTCSLSGKIWHWNTAFIAGSSAISSASDLSVPTEENPPPKKKTDKLIGNHSF